MMTIAIAVAVTIAVAVAVAINCPIPPLCFLLSHLDP